MKSYRNCRWLRVFAVGALGAVAGFQAAQSAWAQSTVGSIAGTIHDPAGAAVTGVELTIKNLANDKTQSAKSDAAGAYNIQNLTPGAYEITAAKYGFSDAKTRVVLVARRQLHADLKLKLAAVAEDVGPTEAKKREDAKRMELMESRLAKLEAELQKKNGQETPAEPKGVFEQASGAAQPAPWEPAGLIPRGPLVATLGKDQIPVSAGKLAPPDLSKAVATTGAPNPSPAAQQNALPDTASTAAPQNAAPAPPASTLPDALQAPEAPPAVDNETPFAYGDFTWLNGTPRNKDTVLDTKFFTAEIRFDTNYIEDFNQPIDHTIVGSTESFRSGEVQVEQISVGGDFHWQNVRGRLLMMDGLYATTTPRSDASSGNIAGVGQWDLQAAYKYVSEAYGGYHFNVSHGLNIDAGIFASYIGLFSYYNFDNWAYQPSYVSSNTPWFFNGVRLQWYPTNKLKIEPWFINGWQSYAKYNGHPGLGGQILWEPREWFKLVANQYGFGEDNLGLPKTQRIHTDDSIEVRYYNNQANGNGISKMAFSLTGDLGCQYGGGVTCHNGANKSDFIGYMFYDRVWWHHDLLAVTVGGGQMSNPGRYLTLLPTINGASASTGTPYFTENPGQPAHMWDNTITLQYMPKEYITWWIEAGHRHSDIPYFAGRGGVTPPGGNNGVPQDYTCMSGASAGTADLGAAEAACGGGRSSVWFPDLRHSETKLSLGVMVKF